MGNNHSNSTDQLKRKSKQILSQSQNNNSNSSLIIELVPERYLALLTEEMTELLVHLMILNETTLDCSTNSDDLSSPISKTTINRSSSPLQSIHQPCQKCRSKMLNIEEFRELHNAFYRVDKDHDNYLTKDEIRIALNYLFELTENDINEIVSVFDTNKDDRISLEEYIGK